jgi:hypothetical protein
LIYFLGLPGPETRRPQKDFFQRNHVCHFQSSYKENERVGQDSPLRPLNSLEIAAELAVSARPEGKGATIALALVEEAIQQKALRYDKSGEEHYNLISTFHKSLRGSDPDAALYCVLPVSPALYP